MTEFLTVKQIVQKSGGPDAIAKAVTERGMKLSAWGVYKWPENGIPEKYWEIIAHLSGTAPHDIYKANVEARNKTAAITCVCSGSRPSKSGARRRAEGACPSSRRRSCQPVSARGGEIGSRRPPEYERLELVSDFPMNCLVLFGTLVESLHDKVLKTP